MVPERTVAGGVVGVELAGVVRVAVGVDGMPQPVSKTAATSITDAVSISHFFVNLTNKTLTP